MIGLLFMALALSTQSPHVGEPVAPVVRSKAVVANPVLAAEIMELFRRDQATIKAVYAVQADPKNKPIFDALALEVRSELKVDNFFDTALKVAWARRPDAPPEVRTYVAWRRATDARIKAIVSADGWPRPAMVGSEAAAAFLFLFGHADEENSWRLSQVPALDVLLREDRVTPQMYAHLRDRLVVLDHRPQIFGTVMGPDRTSGAAKLYAPLRDPMEDTDRRRAAIGLPSMETNLEKFRRGARISSYMTPLMPGESMTLLDVFPVNRA